MRTNHRLTNSLEIGTRSDARVTHYQLVWHPKKGYGEIILHLLSQEGEKGNHVIGVSEKEMPVVSDMLRNERPVYFNAMLDCLYTGAEMVGEGELD